MCIVGIVARYAAIKGCVWLFVLPHEPEGEWTAFALSRDGEEWHDLNQGNEVYDTRSLSGIEGGARDAYITRASGGKGFVMVTTDMCSQKPEVVQLRYQPVAEQRPYTLGVCYVRFP